MATRTQSSNCRGWAWGAALLLTSFTGWSHASPLSYDLVFDLESGYRDNVYFSSDEANPVDDGFVEFRGYARLLGWPTRGLSVGIDYTGAQLIHYTTADAYRLWNAVGVPLTWWPTSWLRIDARGYADYLYNAIFAGEEVVGTGGWASVSGSWSSGEMGIGYGGHARFVLGGPAERSEVNHLPQLHVRQRIASWLTASAIYQFALRRSDEAFFETDGHRLGIGLAVGPWSRVTISEWYVLYTRRLSATDSIETLHANRLEVQVQLADHWSVLGRYEFSYNDAPNSERRFTAHRVGLGVRFAWGRAPTRLDWRQEGLPESTTSQTPSKRPEKTDRGVKFRHRAPRAVSVSLVGSFNGWDAARHPLRQDPSTGEWVIVVELTPGTHEYGFLIDGERFETPEGAERYVDSGFGDRNGVYVVRDAELSER